MPKVELPYGSSKIILDIPDKLLRGIIYPNEKRGSANPSNLIENAINSPIGTEKLDKLVEPQYSVSIVVDDITRPLPTKIVLPILIRKLHNLGIKRERINIIIATGTHRSVSETEAKSLLGEDISKRYKWINHDCDSDSLIYVGKTSFGNRVYLNDIYVNSDFKILIGDVTLHYYAGYGGGPKSIVPGIAGRSTIEFNHSMMFHPNARSGISKGNPVFEDIMEGAKLVGADFVINVVLNSSKEIVSAFAGGLDEVFYRGIKLVDEMYKVSIEEQSEIVIASPGGYPFDINFYQAHKGLINSENAAKRDGTILLLAECRDGIGNAIFEEWLKKYDNSSQVMSELKKRFLIGAHKAYYLLRSKETYNVYLYSSFPEHYVAKILRIKPIRDIKTILCEIFREYDEKEIWVLPFASETLPIV